VTVFTRIVVAYNDSPRARRALETAVQLARDEDHVELIAVAVEKSLLLSGASIGEVQDAHTSRERTCTGWLSAALAYADEHGVALRTEIRIGLVPQQLAIAAAVHHADLLIVGRSGHLAARRRLGTTGNRVSRRARCPIMIVP
jgi:nucleotide-binding universal stress UspA family protein